MYLPIQIYILIFIVSTTSEKVYMKEANVIQEFLKMQTIKPSILLFTCWSKQKNNHLTRTLGPEFSLTILENFTKIDRIKSQLHPLIISDSNCEQFNLFIEQADKLELMRAPYKWLILNTTKDDFIPISTGLLIDSDFVVATVLPEGSIQFELIYKYTKNDRKLIKDGLGLFVENDFLYYNNFSIGRNRTNLNRSNLTVSYVLTHPELPLDVTDYRYRHVDSASKLSYIMVFHLLEILNCSKIFIRRDSWGYKSENATYYSDGMFGDIQNGTVEIGGTVAFYTVDRLEIVDYIGLTTPSDVRFILRAPPLSYVRNIFTLPFQIKVWYSIYIITAGAVFILFLIVVFENKLNFKNTNNIESIKPNFSDVIMVQIGAITQQGSETESKSLSGRIALFVILLILMFLYTAYSANIVVLLQSTSNSIKDIQDLLDSKINLGVEDIVYNRYYFPKQQDSVRKAIFEKKIAPKDQQPNYMSVQEGIHKMRSEFFAFHTETTSGYKVIMDSFHEHEKCGLIEIDYLNTLEPSLAVRKKSPYKEIVTVGKIHETGNRHRQVNRIYFKKPTCGSKGASFTSVGLIDVYFSLEIYCIGFSFAFFLLIVEIVVEKYRARNK